MAYVKKWPEIFQPHLDCSFSNPWLWCKLAKLQKLCQCPNTLCVCVALQVLSAHSQAQQQQQATIKSAGHLAVWSEGSGDRTTNPAISGQP